MQLEPVAYARVHVVRPESTPFVRDQKPTTASVVLKLKPGATLGRNVAAGIVALVARSVEGLTPDNVTVLDTSGRVLSEQTTGEAAGLASSQLEYRREVETYLASKAEDMLAQMLGPGRAIVKVTADINFKRVKEKKENYDPDSRLATKEKVTNKKTTASTSARGPAGTASNLSKQPTDSGSSGTGMQEEETESEYVFSKTISDLEQPAGTIERLTVAAMVDLSAADADQSGQAAPAMTLKEAEEIVKRAVGFKPDRDEIKVSDVKLAGTATDSALDTEWLAAQRWQSYEKIARHSSLGIAALVALVLGRMVLKRLNAPSQAAAAVADRPDRSRVLDQLATEAQQNPEAIARLLAAWLEESDERRKAAA
jgi:flagellar M-ring protein FliF